jgi:hypothetical protein
MTEAQAIAALDVAGASLGALIAWSLFAPIAMYLLGYWAGASSAREEREPDPQPPWQYP